MSAGMQTSDKLNAHESNTKFDCWRHDYEDNLPVTDSFDGQHIIAFLQTCMAGMAEALFEASVSSCLTRAYNAGLAGGFYGEHSAIAHGLRVNREASQSRLFEGGSTLVCVEVLMYLLGLKQGERVREFSTLKR